jgi:MFS family permease
VGAYAGKIKPLVFIIGGNTLFALCLVAFGYTTSFPLALVLLFFMGLGLLCQASMMNTLVQGMVRPEFRGRVMSMYILMFLGMAPVGNFEIGYLTEHLSIPRALTINASVVLLFGAFVFLYRKRIVARYRLYKQQNNIV